MHQSPVGALATEHQGHPQRPVLIGQAADRTVLPLDAHENHEVARGVRLLELEIRVSTAGEEFLQCLDARRRRVGPVPRRPTVRGHERVVGRLVHEREIAADVALYQRLGGLSDALDQPAQVFFGDPRDASCPSLRVRIQRALRPTSTTATSPHRRSSLPVIRRAGRRHTEACTDVEGDAPRRWRS